jgi:hypothetical protein
MTLWIVCDVKSGDGRMFEIVGVFDTEAGADAACTAFNFCYFPVLLNEHLSDESHIAPGVRYPRAE